MSSPKRFICKSIFAALAVLAVCMVTANTQNLFAGTTANTSSTPLGADSTLAARLQASLASLTSAMLPQGTTVDVIVEFNNDVLKTDSKKVKDQKKQARHKIVTDAGGKVDRDFDNFPFHTSKVGFTTLQALGKHSKVKHISVNQPVSGATYTTRSIRRAKDTGGM